MRSTTSPATTRLSRIRKLSIVGAIAMASGGAAVAYGITASGVDLAPPQDHEQAGNGLNAVFGDGSVRFVRDTISLSAWRALGTRSGGEVVSDF